MPITRLGYMYFKVGDSFEVQLLTPGVVMPNDRGISQTFLGNQSTRHIMREAKFVNPDGSRSKWTICLGSMCKWCNGGMSKTISIEEIPIKIQDGTALKMTMNKWMHDGWVKMLEAEKAAGRDPLAVTWNLSYPAPRNFNAKPGRIVDGQKVDRPLDKVAIALTPQEREDLTELLKVLEPMGKTFPEEQYVSVLASPTTYNWSPVRAKEVITALWDQDTGALDISKGTPPSYKDNKEMYR